MDPVILAAGTALVSAMATDAWQRTAAAVAGLWQRARNTQGETIDSDQISNELVSLRTNILQARGNSDLRTEEELEALWRLRLQSLVDRNPALVADLHRLFEEHLLPDVPDGDRERIETLVHQNVRVTGGTSYTSGRDMHIHQPGDTT